MTTSGVPTGGSGRGPGGSGHQGDGFLEPEVAARPYLVTGGRTRARDASVSIETVVILASATAGPHPPAFFERARILAECRRPTSVAEIAARLHLPLAVALVLVGDLVAEGALLASASLPRPGDDVSFIERLIAGVAAL